MEAAGKVNSYGCDVCGQMTFTMNMHNGTTPSCIFCERCRRGTADSNMYRLPMGSLMGLPMGLSMVCGLTIDLVWYRPLPADFDQLDAETKDYVLNGALLHAKPGSVRMASDDVSLDWDYERFQEWCLQTYGVRRAACGVGHRVGSGKWGAGSGERRASEPRLVQ